MIFTQTLHVHFDSLVHISGCFFTRSPCGDTAW
jgi:hypothetical protein